MLDFSPLKTDGSFFQVLWDLVASERLDFFAELEIMNAINAESCQNCACNWNPETMQEPIGIPCNMINGVPTHCQEKTDLFRYHIGCFSSSDDPFKPESDSFLYCLTSIVQDLCTGNPDIETFTQSLINNYLLTGEN